MVHELAIVVVLCGRGEVAVDTFERNLRTVEATLGEECGK
jgi:hypothetical protein